MTTELTTALAVPFTWTEDPSYDLRVAFASGASPADSAVVSGVYRHCLAPTSGTVQDFLRKLQAAVNTEIAALGRGETIAVSISARGRVSIALSTGTATWTLTSSLAALLGFAATSYAGVATITATHLPRHLYLCVGGDGDGHQVETEVAARATTAGSVVGIASGVYRWRETIGLQFIPLNPTLAAGAEEPADWSCWEPDAGGGAAVPWTLAELRRTGLAQECALTRTWPTARTSTTEAYARVYLDPDSLAKPSARQQFPSLVTWFQWDVTVLSPGDATSGWVRAYGTRA